MSTFPPTPLPGKGGTTFRRCAAPDDLRRPPWGGPVEAT